MQYLKSQTDQYDVSQPELHGIYLYIPKAKKGKGELVLLYASDLDVHFTEDGPNYPGLQINETLYTPYRFEIDLSNKDLPVSDYSDYIYDNKAQDYDYDNWYLSNVTAKKDIWSIEEKIIQ